MQTKVASPISPSVPQSGAPGGNYLNTNANEGQFGARSARAMVGLGGGLEQAADVLFKISAERQDRENETHVADVNNWLSEQVTKRWSDYQRLEGRAATDGLPQFQKDVDDLYKQSLTRAGNEQQKMLLQRTGLHLKGQYDRYATNYSDGQFKVWQTNSAAQRAASQANLATISESNDDLAGMNVHLHASDDEVRKIMETKGYGAEEIAQEVSKNRGKNLLNIIALKAGENGENVVGAFNFFKSVQDQMDPASRIAAQAKLRPMLQRQEAHDTTDALVPLYGPKKPVAGLPANFVAGIQQSEGFAPKAKWDHKQFSNGYGTKAEYDGEVIDKQTAQARFEKKLTEAAEFVDSINPNLDPGTRAGMASLTFNAGTAWSKAGLGDAIRAGDIAKAKELFVQYINASGAPLPALKTRRDLEVKWFGKTDINVADAAYVDREAIYNQALTMTEGRAGVQDMVVNNITRRFSMFREGQTARSADFNQRVKDSTAEALTRGVVQQPLTSEDFTTALGIEPGEKAYADYRKNLQLGADVQAIAGMSPDELATARANYEPKPGDGYAAGVERQQQFEKAVTATLKSRDADPALFAMARMPTVQAANKVLAEVMQNPQATPDMRKAAAARFADIMLAEQARVGVAEGDRRVVPQSYIDRLNASIDAPATAGGALNVADRIRAEAAMWGDHWPTVYRQMAKDASPLARVIGSQIPDAPARLLVELAPLKIGDILKDQDAEKANVIKKDVLAAFKPFLQTTLGQEGANRLFDDFRSQAEKLSAYYVVRGESSSASAQRAFKELIGDKYTFVDTYRIPKTFNNKPLPFADASIRAGAVAAKEQLGERPPGAPAGKFEGLLEKGNIDVENRPIVKNADGSVSTVRSMSANIDGREVLLSTVSSDGKVMSDAEAIEAYRRTGKHLGKFEKPEQATAYAKALHDAQEKRYAQVNELDVLPASSQPGVTDAYARDTKLRALRNDGVWVTSPNEDGLMLVYNDQAVRRADGKALIVTWEQLAARGDKRLKASQDVQDYLRRVGPFPRG